MTNHEVYFLAELEQTPLSETQKHIVKTCYKIATQKENNTYLDKLLNELKTKNTETK